MILVKKNTTTSFVGVNGDEIMAGPENNGLGHPKKSIQSGTTKIAELEKWDPDWVDDFPIENMGG